ncbi:relaxase/mobilization nuclease domain-containing protein [Piscinibacter koreensis]|uniref:Relaxase/mobilization nuclease domain-containing protein n=1 Tax=Piscinibacter koreensis TaxID=2742824 RepID=A0A7Y6NRZ9_9BURK|nr:relaxase/mobilization nuclease domain-containing protein [Schlegelella koreensis]NUZ08264.1 relaxase/mobilization nuclease domain-containing protein [Schlegelella koreensis]
MTQPANVDGVLIQWGDRLFYPGNRTVPARREPRLRGGAHQGAAAIRQRIEATALRRAPQVMVKVTGGGRGMCAIAAHLRYISKNGRLEMEDERGEQMQGREALREVADDWRFGGSYIPDVAERREAYNIMLSMPRGTDPLSVQWAAREFARVELADHKYVMVLHDHQTNPHVHISVRAESKHGKRLNPRKADLHRWRETFAEKLRERGIEAEATRQATRGHSRNYEPIWRVKAAEEGRLRVGRAVSKSSAPAKNTRAEALKAWMQIGRALAETREPRDLRLAASIKSFLQGVPTWSSRRPDEPTRVPSAPFRAPASQGRDAPLDRGER